MKTKLKLFAVILCFSMSASGQFDWASVDPTVGANQIYRISSLTIDSANHPYIVGETGVDTYELNHFDGSSWQNIANIINNEIGEMHFDNTGVLWFASQIGLLSYYDTLSNFLQPVPYNPVISGHHTLTFLAIDSNNYKWIATTQYYSTGSYSTYLCRYDGSNWTMYDSTVTGIFSTPALPFNSLVKIVASKNSSDVFAIGREGYLVKYDGTAWVKLDASNSNLIGGLQFIGAEIDNNNNLWLTGYTPTYTEYLIRYDGTQFYYYNPPPAWLVNGIMLLGLAIDSSNNIWCSTLNYGLAKFDGAIWKEYDSYTMAGITPPENGIVIADKKGNVWYGDINGMAQPPLCVFNENGFQSIYGNVYNDTNGNGICDTNENGLANEVIFTSEGMTGLTDSHGNFHVFFTDSSNTVSVNHPLKKYRYHSSSPPVYSVNPLTQSTSGKDFGVAEIPNIADVTTTGLFFPTRPGFNSFGGIDYENIGTTTISDTITLQLDNNYTFLSSIPPPDITNGNKLQWLYYNLAPLSYGHITLNLYVSASVNIGDTLFSTITINPIIGDTVPGDNSVIISKIVTGSFDPNEKEVEPKGTGASGNTPNGETLKFIIHFQNTGTDTAFTVSITDTLSSNLDISTFQFIGSSHPVVTEIRGAGNLKFTFYNILLPDSNTNEPLSQGYVSYKIKAIDNLPLGTEIKNTAYIYFDFNTPVVTNTTLNTIANPTGIPFLNNDYNVNVFPNPIYDISTLEINGMNLNPKLTVKIYDVMGHEINAAISKFSNSRFAIHRSDLTSGLYFYKVSDGSVLITSGKIIIQ